MEITQIRSKHQNNPALRPPNRKLSFTSKRKIFPPKSHPPKAYFPEWHGDASTPHGARRPPPPPPPAAVVSDQISVQGQAEKTSIDISLGKVLDLFSQASTPASWYDTEVGDYNEYQQTRQQGLFVTPTPDTPMTAQGEDQQQEHQEGPNVTSNPAVAVSAQEEDSQRRRQQSSTPTSTLSAKAQGKRPFVEPAVMLQDQTTPEAYPQLASDVQQSTPSQAASDPDTQWAYHEAEKVYARQAREDPTWSDGTTVDSPIDVEKFDTLSITTRKRRSPAPEAETPSSSTISKRTKTKDQQRSHTRRYITLSPKFKAERDQLISAITINWLQDIRLAIPEDLCPRHSWKNQDVPAEPQDWSVTFLRAALAFSKKTRGEPDRAREALRKVAMTPGRQYAWLVHPDDFEKAAKLLKAKKSSSVQNGIIASGSDSSNDIEAPRATSSAQDEIVIASASDPQPTNSSSVQDEIITSEPPPSSGLEALLSALCSAAADEANARRDLKDLTRASCSDEVYQGLTEAVEKLKEADAKKMSLKKEIAMYLIAN